MKRPPSASHGDNMDTSGALTFQTQLHMQLDPAWTDVCAINLDMARDSSNPPDACILVYGDGAPLVRLNIHRPGEVVHDRMEAIAWGEWIMAGFSARVVAVRLRDGAQHTTLMCEQEPPNFAAFFYDFLHEDAVCIARTDERLFRFGADGRLLWKSEELGYDGVVVHDITNNFVDGSGQFDAPDGWRPFRISLATGQAIDEARQP